MLRSKSQILISWDRPDAEPTIEGDFTLVADSPLSSRVLAFESWLERAQAVKVEQATGRLLKRGEAFATAVVSLRGRHLEIDGRPVSGSAVMRIRDVSGERLQLAQLRDQFAQAEGALDGLRRALETADMPAWTRDAEGRIAWCNIPYARAVDAPDDKAAIERGSELFDSAVRREAAACDQGDGRLEAPRRRRSSEASVEPSRPSRRARRSAPPASPTMFPRSRRFGRIWSATRMTIRG